MVNTNPILSKGNGEKVRSPENLNDYIKVSNIGVWVILGVLLLLFYILHSTFYILLSTFYFLLSTFYIEGKPWLLFAPFAAKS